MIKLGVYKHYKGNEYLVIGLGKHSETEEELVIYKALYGDRELWIRPLEMFFENVSLEAGSKPRFEWVREME